MAHVTLQLVPLPARSDGATTCSVEPGRSVVAGPGWFDSSWELRQGLDVREEGSGEEALFAWIDDFVRAQRASCGRTASPSASTAMA